MNEIEVMKYLLAEIEEEIAYAEKYREAKIAAIHQANDNYGTWWKKYMPDEYDTVPKKSIIKANSMKIRQLLLKLYDGGLKDE